MEVKETFTRFMQDLPEDIIKRKSLLDTLNISSACEVRDLATNLFESSIFDHTGISGGNNSDHPLKCEIKGNKFLLPQHSRLIFILLFTVFLIKCFKSYYCIPLLCHDIHIQVNKLTLYY